jgi:hypothetical protein
MLSSHDFLFHFPVRLCEPHRPPAERIRPLHPALEIQRPRLPVGNLVLISAGFGNHVFPEIPSVCHNHAVNPQLFPFPLRQKIIILS